MEGTRAERMVGSAGSLWVGDRGQTQSLGFNTKED